MNGWKYRLGIRIKEWGELLGISFLIRLGLENKDEALRWKN